MMTQPTSIVLVAALLINTLSYCSAENLYCVTPTATSCSSCPHNTHCATLSEYAQEAELYFTSNTTMVFLPGDHVLDRNIIVANVTSLTMHGKSSHNITTVVHNGSVGFSFTNMVDFNIYSLAFTSYNRSWSYGSHPASNSALLLRSTQNAKLVNCSFHDNFGTALAVIDSSITLEENSKFISNQCTCQSFSEVHDYGCGIAALNSTLTFIGNTCFHENTQTASSSSYFMYGGGAIWASASSLHFNGMNSFTGNSANGSNGVGGAIFAEANSLFSFSGTSTFRHNSAEYSGGAIYAEYKTSVGFNGTTNFIYNSAGRYGGAIEAYENVFMFHGTNNFINNSAGRYGGAIDAYVNVVLTFYGTNNFFNNSVNNFGGGAIYVGYNTSLTFIGISSLISNCAVQGGAIFAYDSTLTFNEKISFTDNGHNTKDSCGGAIYLESATFSILPNTTVCWENNHANLGGAIYVYDADRRIYCTQNDTYNIQKPKCFFQLHGQDLSNGADVQLVFKNNYADVAGSVLYGGAIDNCMLVGLDSNSSGEVFDMLVRNEDDTDYSTSSNISSKPFRICPCENDIPDCSISSKVLTVYPGESYEVSVAVVGQREGIVPANVTNMDRCILPCSEFVQQTYKTCTTLSYTVDTAMNVSLELNVQNGPSCGDDNLILRLDGTQSCPLGLSLESGSCVCDQVLKNYTNHCSVVNESIQIIRQSDDTFWVGLGGLNDSGQFDVALFLHPHCPFDYCVNETVVFTLNNSDIQCAHNRSGLLCGACKNEQCNDSLACNSTRHSLVLGSSHCKQCSNLYLLLVIPFAGMGVALVFLIFVCKLTVATGTLSGLVLYANIVGDNRTIFLPVKSANPLSVFIAWLNLDFGIETCFYDGMDAYSKTWLQLVFPTYLWVLVGIIILISHFSQKFAKLLGNNPVSVLATLILLSYTKTLRTLIAAVSFINIEYHNISFTGLQYQEQHNRRSWLYDANIEYFDDIHILLFLVAVLGLLFYFLPYTLLLLFGQWLQAISHLRLFSLVNSTKLKPFMDSYHAPYKPRHRYWPGLLLLLRCALLLVFAFNYQRDPNINLLAILVGTGILTIWAWVSGGVYKNWCLDALEGSFVLNLIVLVGATMYINATYNKSQREENQLRAGYTSVSVAFAAFIGILSYHIFQQLRHTKLWKKIPKQNMKLRVKKMNTKLKKKLSTKQTEDISLNDLTNDLTESVKFDQLREPLLDDLPQPTYSVV